MFTALTNAQFTAPAAADGVTLTTTGVAWTNTAWSELDAGVSADAALTGIVCRPVAAGSVRAIPIEIDIGTGAAAAEVVIATFRLYHRQIFDASTDVGLCVRLPIGIANIASGARLSTRMRWDSTQVLTYAIAATYIKLPITGEYLTTAQPLLPIPSAAAQLVVTAGAGVYANGAYVQVRSAAGAAIVLAAIIAASDTGSQFEFDIATGGAGSETVISTFGSNMGGAQALPWHTAFPLPLDNIAASARVAVRARSSSASAVAGVSLNWIEKPL